MSYQKLLKDSCDIQERSESVDEYGEVDNTFVNKTTGVATRRSRIKEPTVLESGYQTTIEDFKFYFLPTVDLQKNDIIVFNSENYKVLGVQKDSSDHHLEVYAQLVSHD